MKLLSFTLQLPLQLTLLTLSLPAAEKTKPPKPEHAFEYRFDDSLQQTPDSLERINKWFTDAKFGAFIHFGVYSMLEGEYQGRGSGFRYSEWVQFSGKIPCAEYRELAKSFNPSKFNANEWATTFKEAGIKYVVITSKHHDGFALFDSDVDPFNIADHTPFKRDLIKELCEACHAQGLKFGVYYSHAQDWSQPDAPYLNNRTKLHELHPDLPADYSQQFDRYLQQKSFPQVEELVKKYPLDLIWFDTPVGMDLEKAKAFSDIVRKHRPDCLINSRIIHRGKGVIEQEALPYFDYVSIGDKEVPTKKLPLYVESPDSVSSSFGYKTKGDHYYHTEEEMLQRFVNTVCAGGNALINNGPMGNGLLDPEAVRLYQSLGKWLKTNGEAIYHTQRNPLAQPPSWGNLTISKDRKSLYLHVFDWPESLELLLDPLSVKVTSAHLLDGELSLAHSQQESGIKITLPASAPDATISVIKLQLDSPLSE